MRIFVILNINDIFEQTNQFQECFIKKFLPINMLRAYFHAQVPIYFTSLSQEGPLGALQNPILTPNLGPPGLVHGGLDANHVVVGCLSGYGLHDAPNRKIKGVQGKGYMVPQIIFTP